jgi:hypothetical protein
MLNWLGLRKAKDTRITHPNATETELNARSLLFGAEVEAAPIPSDATPETDPAHSEHAPRRPVAAYSLLALGWAPVPVSGVQMPPPSKF